jgi:hypothetical protein
VTDHLNEHPDENDDGPDAFAILHFQPGEPQSGHLIGPYPVPHVIAQLIADASKCDCSRTVLPIWFPSGVRMSVTVEAPVAFEQGEGSDLMN